MTDQAWQLLKLYLDRLGSRDGHVYYRCVASKLLSAGAALPTWLVNDYKVRRHARIILSRGIVYVVCLLFLKGYRAIHVKTSQEVLADPERCHTCDFPPTPLSISCILKEVEETVMLNGYRLE